MSVPQRVVTLAEQPAVFRGIKIGVVKSVGRRKLEAVAETMHQRAFRNNQIFGCRRGQQRQLRQQTTRPLTHQSIEEASRNFAVRTRRTRRKGFSQQRCCNRANPIIDVFDISHITALGIGLSSERNANCGRYIG